WATTAFTSLLVDPFQPDFAERIERWADEWSPERTWGARHRGRWVGTLTTLPRRLTIPDGTGGTHDESVDALSLVSVAATHRRRGLLTAMISDSLRAAKDRGDAFGALVAAEWAIYGRFGYAPAVRSADYTYYPRRQGATVAGDGAGTVRQVDPSELIDVAPAVFERARRQRAGEVDRPGGWWRRQLNVGYDKPQGPQYNWVLHEGPDGADGLLAWRVTRNFTIDGHNGGIEVPQLIAASELAYRNLWAYLGGIDVVEEITLSHRPVDEPVRWLLGDGRTLQQGYTGDYIWLTLLDVPAALSRRGYATEGRLVLDVVDESSTGYASGRVVLDAGPDGAQCRPSTESPDLRLPARTLAACYLGGHTLAPFRAAGQVEELTTGATRRLDAMLATPLAPACQTGF
ncbi:MAG: GNAT family N-acetyltransferase, partial [Actinobacteria bacterium]|nr:GNAT family N-acetyltransferase [Actinomycetota bacterium]